MQTLSTAGIQSGGFSWEIDMAVLHHAFRCAITPAFERTVSKLLAAWAAGEREMLSGMALEHYAALAGRRDIHAAFHLEPDGAAPSWLQPQFISPGLAALVMLAGDFVPLPTLSGGSDTNHDRLATRLPALGWTTAEIDHLIRGAPIETMLQAYADRGVRLLPGGFRHTGGWTSRRIARNLELRMDQLLLGPPPEADEAARDAWRQLDETDELDAARAMLATVREGDWLVTAITH